MGKSERYLFWAFILLIAVTSLIFCPVNLEDGISYASSWGIPVTFGISALLISIKLRSAGLDTLKPLAVFIVAFGSPWIVILTIFASDRTNLISYYEGIGKNHFLMLASWFLYLALSSYIVSNHSRKIIEVSSVYMVLSAVILSVLPICSIECLACIPPACLFSIGVIGIAVESRGSILSKALRGHSTNGT